MISLAVQLEQYLAIRRSFGYDLSTAERILRRFVEFAEAEGVNHVNVDLFLLWKRHFGSANNNTWSVRLGVLRCFAGWLQNIDPLTEVPPSDLVRGKSRRSRPYIYSSEQITQLVASAARLPSSYGLRGWTYSTFFGLIAVSGLRINEAIQLDEEDVDLNEGVLLVKRGKNGKSRMIPISACATAQLTAYRCERNRILV